MRGALLDRLLRIAVTRAGWPGDIRFTERQLYYEVCRVARPEHHASRRPAFTLAPAVRYGEFLAAVRRHAHRHGEVAGLLRPAELRPSVGALAGAHTPEPDLFDYGLPRLLVCQSDAVARMLRANGLPMASACPMYGAGELPLHEGVVTMMERAGRAAVYVLHDASARGMDFPHRLAALTPLPAGVRVVPLGLRPRQAGALHLTHGRAPAGAHPGAGVELDGWERRWLGEGRFVEVAAARPVALLRTVHRRVREIRPPARTLAELRRVRGAGFLSWPT
jgi:hypothetical protein